MLPLLHLTFIFFYFFSPFIIANLIGNFLSVFGMADDIDELLDEVESKFIHVEPRVPESQEPTQTVKR